MLESSEFSHHNSEFNENSVQSSVIGKELCGSKDSPGNQIYFSHDSKSSYFQNVCPSYTKLLPTQDKKSSSSSSSFSHFQSKSSLKRRKVKAKSCLSLWHLKNIFNKDNFNCLPVDIRKQLISFMPHCDQIVENSPIAGTAAAAAATTKISPSLILSSPICSVTSVEKYSQRIYLSSTAMNNEFFNRALTKLILKITSGKSSFTIDSFVKNVRHDGGLKTSAASAPISSELSDGAPQSQPPSLTLPILPGGGGSNGGGGGLTKSSAAAAAAAAITLQSHRTAGPVKSTSTDCSSSVLPFNFSEGTASKVVVSNAAAETAITEEADSTVNDLYHSTLDLIRNGLLLHPASIITSDFSSQPTENHPNYALDNFLKTEDELDNLVHLHHQSTTDETISQSDLRQCLVDLIEKSSENDSKIYKNNAATLPTPPPAKMMKREPSKRRKSLLPTQENNNNNNNNNNSNSNNNNNNNNNNVNIRCRPVRSTAGKLPARLLSSLSPPLKGGGHHYYQYQQHNHNVRSASESSNNYPTNNNNNNNNSNTTSNTTNNTTTTNNSSSNNNNNNNTSSGGGNSKSSDWVLLNLRNKLSRRLKNSAAISPSVAGGVQLLSPANSSCITSNESKYDGYNSCNKTTPAYITTDVSSNIHHNSTVTITTTSTTANNTTHNNNNNNNFNNINNNNNNNSNAIAVTINGNNGFCQSASLNYDDCHSQKSVSPTSSCISPTELDKTLSFNQGLHSITTNRTLSSDHYIYKINGGSPQWSYTSEFASQSSMESVINSRFDSEDFVGEDLLEDFESEEMPPPRRTLTLAAMREKMRAKKMARIAVGNDYRPLTVKIEEDEGDIEEQEEDDCDVDEVDDDELKEDDNDNNEDDEDDNDDDNYDDYDVDEDEIVSEENIHNIKNGRKDKLEKERIFRKAEERECKGMGGMLFNEGRKIRNGKISQNVIEVDEDKIEEEMKEEEEIEVDEYDSVANCGADDDIDDNVDDALYSLRNHKKFCTDNCLDNMQHRKQFSQQHLAATVGVGNGTVVNQNHSATDLDSFLIDDSGIEDYQVEIDDKMLNYSDEFDDLLLSAGSDGLLDIIMKDADSIDIGNESFSTLSSDDHQSYSSSCNSVISSQRNNNLSFDNLPITQNLMSSQSELPISQSESNVTISNISTFSGSGSYNNHNNNNNCNISNNNNRNNNNNNNNNNNCNGSGISNNNNSNTNNNSNNSGNSNSTNSSNSRSNCRNNSGSSSSTDIKQAMGSNSSTRNKSNMSATMSTNEKGGRSKTQMSSNSSNGKSSNSNSNNSTSNTGGSSSISNNSSNSNGKSSQIKSTKSADICGLTNDFIKSSQSKCINTIESLSSSKESNSSKKSNNANNSNNNNDVSSNSSSSRNSNSSSNGCSNNNNNNNINNIISNCSSSNIINNNNNNVQVNSSSQQASPIATGNATGQVPGVASPAAYLVDGNGLSDALKLIQRLNPGAKVTTQQFYLVNNGPQLFLCQTPPAASVAMQPTPSITTTTVNSNNNNDVNSNNNNNNNNKVPAATFNEKVDNLLATSSSSNHSLHNQSQSKVSVNSKLGNCNNNGVVSTAYIPRISPIISSSSSLIQQGGIGSSCTNTINKSANIIGSRVNQSASIRLLTPSSNNNNNSTNNNNNNNNNSLYTNVTNPSFTTNTISSTLPTSTGVPTLPQQYRLLLTGTNNMSPTNSTGATSKLLLFYPKPTAATAATATIIPHQTPHQQTQAHHHPHHPAQQQHLILLGSSGGGGATAGTTAVTGTNNGGTIGPQQSCNTTATTTTTATFLAPTQNPAVPGQNNLVLMNIPRPTATTATGSAAGPSNTNKFAINFAAAAAAASNQSRATHHTVTSATPPTQFITLPSSAAAALTTSNAANIFTILSSSNIAAAMTTDTNNSIINNSSSNSSGNNNNINNNNNNNNNNSNNSQSSIANHNNSQITYESVSPSSSNSPPVRITECEDKTSTISSSNSSSNHKVKSTNEESTKVIGTSNTTTTTNNSTTITH